jgi:hypothetical protein
MNDHGGLSGLIAWAGFYILGLFTMQSWSLLMGGLAALCTAVYYGAKGIKEIKDIMRKK